MASLRDLTDPITAICLGIYPDQSDVLQASSETPYWQNGANPIDHVSVYVNSGTKNPLSSKHIDEFRHLHYVSLGITDLYGDERVHKTSSTDEPSGFGYELTMRVPSRSDDDTNGLWVANAQPPRVSSTGKCTQGNVHSSPPSRWPIDIMQSLARYTFKHGSLLASGDHVPFIFDKVVSTVPPVRVSTSDGGVTTSDSRLIRHVLIVDDPELCASQTRFGRVKFLQLVGCTDDELAFAQRWSAAKLVELMRSFHELGGRYLLTDLNRARSIFELRPELVASVSELANKEGSQLSFVKSTCLWRANSHHRHQLTNRCSEFRSASKITLFMDIKSVRLLPVILKQRLERGKSFIFNGVDDRNLILIPPGFISSECHVSSKQPLRSNHVECQLFVSRESAAQLEKLLCALNLDTLETTVGQLPLSKSVKLGGKESKSFDLHLHVISADDIQQLDVEEDD